MNLLDQAKRMNVVAVGPTGWLEVRDDLEIEGKHTALGFYKKWWVGVKYFHRDGKVYEIISAEPKTALGPLSAFLARTVYNPVVDLRYKVQPVGSYEFSRLRELAIVAIENDDDVLTQFRDAPELRTDLAGASTFTDLVRVVLSGARGEGVV